jgi:outer membrane lipoprotein-sorting protein
MTSRPAVALVAVLALTASLALAGELAAPQRSRTDVGALDKLDPAVAKTLDKLRAAQASTKSMSAAFRQVKEDSLFAQPSIQSGQFIFATPDRFRWDYEKPERVVVVATADTFERYLPDQKLLRRLDLSKNRRRVFSYFGIGSDVEVLERHFNISVVRDPAHPTTEKLELRGKRRRVQKRMTLLEMWLDQTTSLPAMIKVTMADGGTTLWEFKSIKANPPLSDDTFKVKVAQGTIIQSEENPNSPLVDELLEDEDAATGGSSGAAGASAP